MKLVKKICKQCGKEYKGISRSCHCSDECCKKFKANSGSRQQHLKSISKYDPKMLKTCKICGYQSIILSHHIKNEHNLTTKEYCEKFNCDKYDVFSKEYVEKKAKEYCDGLKEGKYKNNFQINNPGKNHGGKFSPYSKNFIKYEGLSQKEVDNTISQIFEKRNELYTQGDILSSQFGYWLKQGLSQEEALLKLKKRQTTFTLEKCIAKYGEEEGTKRWKKRQERWLKSFTNKPQEELERIYKAKMEYGGYSKISQDLFWKLYERIKDKFKKIYFATLDKQSKQYTEKNNEYVLFINPKTPNNGCYFLDFLVLDCMKVIEFDGDYWHSRAENKERDEKRNIEILTKGFEILHIKECDYRLNEQQIIDNCIEFLGK